MKARTRKSSINRWLRAVALMPFHILMGTSGMEAVADPLESLAPAVEAAAGVVEAPATDVETAVAPEPTAEDMEREAAIQRGDIIPNPPEETFNPDILAKVAGEPAVPVVEAKAGSIPLPRFNEVLDENKRLKEQLANGKPAPVGEQEHVAVAPPVTTEIAALEARLIELQEQADDIFQESGPTEERTALLTEINRINRQIVKLDVQQEQNQERRLTEITTSLESVATQAYSLYPFLDNKSADADVDAINAVSYLRDQLIATGTAPAEALQQAIDEKGPKFAKLLVIPLPTSMADAIRTARETEAQTRAANASLTQPAPLPSRTEKDGFEVNVATLSDAQIKAMPEEQKARLRGDVV